eukprot:Skav202146  [mRNA]  locus=scaffold970:34838:39207:+ [translate_table: standard]
MAAISLIAFHQVVLLLLEDRDAQAHQALLRHVQKQFSRLAPRKGRPKTVREKADTWEGDEEAGEVHGKAKKDKKAETKETWESFKAGDEAEADLAEADGDAKMDTGDAAKAKKRTRGGDKNEPPTESVMAHNAVQALLDAWEAESDEEAMIRASSSLVVMVVGGF